MVSNAITASGISPPDSRPKDGKSGASEATVLTVLLSDHPSDAVGRILSLAREHLGMDVAFLSEFVRDEQVFRAIEGDPELFGVRQGDKVPLEGTLCRRLMNGVIPNVVNDANSQANVRDLDITRNAGIGSYIGVPLRHTDGRLYGTLCCVSRLPDPTLRSRDAEFMKLLARLMVEQLEREELQSKDWRLRIKTTGVEALLAALEARDGYTGEHSVAVIELSLAVVRRMALSDEELTDIKQAALLHDVGKLGILDAILDKPAPLDAEEWEIMAEHPKIGERIVSSLESLAHLAPIIRSEHERWDGKGYPDGLSGDRIPLASRIIFVCDSFHAMISDRPYRKALDVREAAERLRRNSGTQFCPLSVRTLLSVINEGRPAERRDRAS